MRKAIEAEFNASIAPKIEGFDALVRVRRRQDAGVAQIATLYPEVMAREAKLPMGVSGIIRRALRDPVGFVVYAAVSVAVKAQRGGGGWTRGR